MSGLEAIVGAGLAPYLALILFGFLPSEVWRVLGVVLSRGLDERSEILVFVRAVATTLLAAVVAKLLVFPSGALVLVPLPARLGAVAFGLLAFYLARRSLIAGVVAGEVFLVAAATLALEPA
ncbi:MAG: AzlD domain-containing protein [Salinarimonas sp.]